MLRSATGGSVLEAKELTRKSNGEEVGIIEGYIAAWSPDRGGRFGVPDVFHKGAFLDSLAIHKKRGNRPIRLKDNHGRLIGGFPIATVHEDDTGLFGIAEVNLISRQGREAFSLARQDVLRDFSIGFSADDEKLMPNRRDIFKATVWEGSLVDEPLNVDAQITEVKVAVEFQDLPLAARMAPWNISAAKKRVKDLLESKVAPGPEFKTAHVWFDTEREERFDGYNLLIADVEDGKLIAIPRAIFKAAIEVKTNAAGIPEEDRAGVIKHLEQYYAKMGLVSPFTEDEKHFFDADSVKKFSKQDLERALQESGAFSRKAATILTSRFQAFREPAKNAILAELAKIKI